MFTNCQVDKELNKLKELLAQRDTEINILVNLLKKEKAKIKGGGGGGGFEKPISPPPVKPHHQTQRNVKTLSKVSSNLELCVCLIIWYLKNYNH